MRIADWAGSMKVLMYWHNRHHQTRLLVIKLPVWYHQKDGTSQLLTVVYMCHHVSFLFQMDGFQRHFDSQIISYGKQMIVNLVCLRLSFLTAVLFSRLLRNTVSLVLIYLSVLSPRLTKKVQRSLSSKCLRKWWTAWQMGWSGRWAVKWQSGWRAEHCLWDPETTCSSGAFTSCLIHLSYLCFYEHTSELTSWAAVRLKRRGDREETDRIKKVAQRRV